MKAPVVLISTRGLMIVDAERSCQVLRLVDRTPMLAMVPPTVVTKSTRTYRTFIRADGGSFQEKE